MDAGKIFLDTLHLAVWRKGGCSICGKPERGGYVFAHRDGCWNRLSLSEQDTLAEVCRVERLKPIKTPEQLRAELEQIAKEVLNGW